MSEEEIVQVDDWRHYEPLDLPPVLKHALEAMVEHGYHGTSVRDIAKRLGQTVPAIYYHFENKQALLTTLLNDSVEAVLHRCQLAVLDAGPDPVARFRNLVECVVLYITHRRPLSFLDAEIRSLEPQNRATYVAVRDAVDYLFIDAVRDGIAEGQLADHDPALTVRAVLAMCHGIAVWYDPGGAITPNELAERYVQYALALVGWVNNPMQLALEGPSS